MFFPVVFFIPFVLGAPTQKALEKILVDNNPDSVTNREKIRGIIDKAFENRVPRVQGRQGVAPPVTFVGFSLTYN